LGEGWCFLLNGLSYVAVLTALLRMRVGGADASFADRILAGGPDSGRRDDTSRFVSDL
jgi:hypothetical protein